MKEPYEELSRRSFLQTSAAVAVAGLQARAGRALATPAAAPAGLPFASALEAAARIRSGDVSSVELTGMMIQRIDEHDKKLNAVVVRVFEQALKRAALADAAMSKGESWGPFHGVPVTVKESFDLTGLPTTVGVPALRDNLAKADALVATRIQETGAVILGKTNVPFMLGDHQSYNQIYGTTNNPWNLERTSGGSTGGGAAALAAGLSYLSLGSDIGGSIRVPAHFCGVYGHKPSIHLVPSRGHVPPLPSDPPGPPPSLPVVGPLARSAGDLMAALRAVAGPDPATSPGYSWQMPAPRRERLSEYRVGAVLDDPFCPVPPEVRQPLEIAIAALRKAGVEVETGWPVGIDPVEQLETYLYLLFVILRLPIGPPSDFYPKLREAGVAVPVDVAEIQARAAKASLSEFQEMQTRQARAQAAWAAWFKSHDAFLMPVDFVAAPRHDHSFQFTRTLETSQGKRAYSDQLYWISFATLAGLPATSAPVGRSTDDALPVGIQIVGPMLEDATPIDIAAKMADVVGGFEAPPGWP